MFTLKDSNPGEPLLLHDEPIYMDDKIIGRSTSGNYSFNFKKNLVFGYINSDLSNKELQSKGLKRMLLHAESINFKNLAIEQTAPVPEVFSKYV